MINIESKKSFPKKLLERAVKAALKHQSASLDSDLTVVLMDDAHVQELNRDYLGIDSPTDVLSFPASELDGSEINPGTGARYIGDIIISIPYAAKSAAKAGCSKNQVTICFIDCEIIYLNDYAAAGSACALITAAICRPRSARVRTSLLAGARMVPNN